MCTPDHPFFTQGGGWVEAGSLGIGTSIVSRAGPALQVTALTWEKNKAEELAAGTGSSFGGYTVYNLTVEDDHTFFVGTAGGGTWVHNIDCLGGRYKDVPANGGQVHHTPADSISPLNRGQGPGFRMDTLDHYQTGSWGSSASAQTYRAAQRALIDQGKFDDAIQMDIDNVRGLFGNKYDEGILQMIGSL